MYGFSVWVADGAELQAGTAYGATDDTEWKSAENVVHWHDFHATVLRLLGINHKKLTFYHNGMQRRLTNVHGNMVSGILSQLGQSTRWHSGRQRYKYLPMSVN